MAVSGSLGAANAVLQTNVDVLGYGFGDSRSLGAAEVGIQVSGTWSGTITFQASVDGTNFVSVAAAQVLGSGLLGNFSSTTTANGLFSVPNHGFQIVRAKMTTYSSGTATVTLDLSASGHQLVQTNSEGQKASYRMVATGLAGLASSGVFVTLQGSATKTVRVTRVEINGSTATGAGIQDLQLGIATALTAGTATTAPSLAKLDSADANPTAVAAAYSVADSAVTQTLVYAGKLAGGATPAIVNFIAEDFGTRPGARCLTLRGTAQWLTINTSAAVSGQTFDLTIEFTEE